jgi:hypothetical protein
MFNHERTNEHDRYFYRSRIECQQLVRLVRQHLVYRHECFERIQHLQALLLTSNIVDDFRSILFTVAMEQFTRSELDRLEQTTIIDMNILTHLRTLCVNDLSRSIRTDFLV